VRYENPKKSTPSTKDVLRRLTPYGNQHQPEAEALDEADFLGQSDK